ncbi:hypothetical protein [Photobacterium leiognathi]|uniref:hypothetical protein n=1 Tax=Photobacterium leiognathi TaxID=553611 RepID=UPI0029818D04|nr:hypothetical protein [Photobacterium leiognathi]
MDFTCTMNLSDIEINIGLNILINTNYLRRNFNSLHSESIDILKNEIMSHYAKQIKREVKVQDSIDKLLEQGFSKAELIDFSMINSKKTVVTIPVYQRKTLKKDDILKLNDPIILLQSIKALNSQQSKEIIMLLKDFDAYP